MQKINSATDIKQLILQLENQQTIDLKRFKEQLNLTYENIKPINLVKNTFKQVVASEELTDNIVNTSVSLAAGYVSKILFEKASHSPFRKLVGTALLFGVTNLVAKKPHIVKSIGIDFFNIVKYQLSNRFS
jgi:hypothetical protein